METKLSQRARRALDLLKRGGEVVYRVERNSRDGRAEYQTRFLLCGEVVPGLGFATRTELEEAGFRLFRVRHSSASSYFRLAA